MCPQPEVRAVVLGLVCLMVLATVGEAATIIGMCIR